MLENFLKCQVESQRRRSKVINLVYDLSVLIAVFLMLKFLNGRLKKNK